MTIRVLLARDSEAMLYGYSPEYEYREVWRADSHTDQVGDALAYAFARCQNVSATMAAPYVGRSLAVGDVIAVDERYFAVAPVGFTEVTEDFSPWKEVL